MPVLAHDSICPLPCLRFGRFDLEAEFLGHVPAHESANAVVLPVGRFGDLRERCAFRLINFQDFLNLAAPYRRAPVSGMAYFVQMPRKCIVAIGKPKTCRY